jgi:hypothetical protein
MKLSNAVELKPPLRTVLLFSCLASHRPGTEAERETKRGTLLLNTPYASQCKERYDATSKSGTQTHYRSILLT